MPFFPLSLFLYRMSLFSSGWPHTWTPSALVSQALGDGRYGTLCQAYGTSYKNTSEIVENILGIKTTSFRLASETEKSLLTWRLCRLTFISFPQALRHKLYAESHVFYSQALLGKVVHININKIYTLICLFCSPALQGSVSSLQKREGSFSKGESLRTRGKQQKLFSSLLP